MTTLFPRAPLISAARFIARNYLNTIAVYQNGVNTDPRERK